jgi:hypothetical protein
MPTLVQKQEEGGEKAVTEVQGWVVDHIPIEPVPEMMKF